MGHHLVNDDCNRFTPIKAVNHNQFIEKFVAKYRDTKIITPAIKRKDSLIVIFVTLFKLELPKLAYAILAKA